MKSWKDALGGTDAYMKSINGCIKIGICFRSYEVTSDHLHGPPLKYNSNCISSIISVIDSSAFLGL